MKIIKNLVLVSPVIFLLILTATAEYYSSSLGKIFKHPSWYMLNDLDSIPINLALSGTIVDEYPTLRAIKRANEIETVEVRSILRKHGFLTPEWRNTVNVYLSESKLVFEGVQKRQFERVMEEVLAAYLSVDENLIFEGVPHRIDCVGCLPPMLKPSEVWLINSYAGPRQVCDNILGGLAWMFLVSIFVCLIMLLKVKKS